MKSKKKALAMSVLCAVASVGFVVNASAAEATDQALANYELEGIVVEGTLWKAPQAMAGGNVNTGYGAGIMGVQDLQSTPFTVTSFTEKAIQDYSDPTQPLPSVLVNNPSVRSTACAFYDDFSIRGIKLNGDQLFLNGIPGMFAQGTTPTNYLERVDVTSGPAMTTNMATAMESTGGMVNMVSKKAGDKPVSTITLGFSGRGTYTQQIDVGSRFGKDNAWGIRVNALNTDGETSIAGEEKRQRNIFINLDHRDKNSSTNLLMGYVDDRVENSLRWFGPGSGLTHIPSAPDNSTNYGFKAMKWEADKWITTLNHEQKLGNDWSAFLNAGYGRYDTYNHSNGSWFYNIYDGGRIEDYALIKPFKYDNKSLQLGVKGKIKTGDITHNLVIAADKTWRKNYETEAEDLGGLIGTLGGGLSVQPDHIPSSTKGSPSLAAKHYYTSYKLVDKMEIGKFDVMAGVIKQEASITSSGVTSDTDGVSPLYSVMYKPTDKLSIYASHSESFGSGVLVSTVASNYFDNGNDILDPLKTKQNELGIKYNTGKIMTSLAFFDIKSESRATFTNPQGEYGHIYTNDGENRYKGVDLSVYGKLADKWNFMGGLMYVNAKTEKTSDGANDGLRINGVPRWSGVAALEYQPSDDWSIFGRGVYNGSYTMSNEKYSLPSYFTVDLGAKYKTKLNRTPVTFSAMVYNVFDKDYWQPIARSDRSIFILSNPRTFMLSATFEL